MKQVFIVKIETDEEDFCCVDLGECIKDGSENIGNHTIKSLLIRKK